MKLYHYAALDGKAQWDQLWDLGTYLVHFVKGDMKYVLYGLGDFFVEVRYDRVHNRILGKKHFRKGQELDKYLSMVHMDGPI